ncbi:MAG: peptidoglycan-binding protein, partial [bacterium]|nr:peptidoglycan-binding protein [bacterium]
DPPEVFGLPPLRICPKIIRTLNQGISGSDVKDLQAYLGVSQTGYFGPLTARAVAQFQASEGLSQVGSVGPQTRAAFARKCGGGGNSQSFSASPTSGAAPLAVTFRTNITNNLDSYSINFGDGSTGTFQVGACTVEGYGSNCGRYIAPHTYTSVGTYTASLVQKSACPFVGDGPCYQDQTPYKRTVGTVTITVGGSTNPVSFTASPTSGTALLDISFFATVAGNVDPSAYRVEFGDGTSGTMYDNGPTPLPCGEGPGSPTCGLPTPPRTKTNMFALHTYTTNGTYTANLMYQQLTPTCPSGAACMPTPPPQIVGTVTITVGGTTSGGAPSISGLDAPTSLSVGQTGTWTVHASAPSGTQLSYSVTWGDEVYYGIGNLNAQTSAAPIQASATFTHAYQNAGTFSPSFVVSNSSGLVKTSASVVVGGSTSGNFSAYPTSGTTPLAVTFHTTTNPSTNGSTFIVDFGDGTTGQMQSDGLMGICVVGAGGPCNGYNGLLVSHTYITNGTYTATLFKDTCPAGAQCFVGPLPVGTVMITVYQLWW